MHTITQLQERISREILNIKLNKPPKELYEPIEYTIESGGKRIRPALVLAAHNMFSESIEEAIPVSLAFEVFHNFTLLHDDIMDNSPVRRNKATVHKKWDANTAILSGDAMMILAYSFLKELEAEKMKSVFTLFNKTAMEVCEGQQYDMNFENRNDVSEEEYLEMIKLKTSVLIAACLKAGAITGGASNEDADKLYNFGLNIGLAFQLKDDLLDVYANFEDFGKQIGNDILTAKKTFLLINALEHADSKMKEELIQTLYDSKLKAEDKIRTVTDVYDVLQIKDLTEKKINDYHQKALDAMQSVSVNEEKKQVLLGFAESIMNRKK